MSAPTTPSEQPPPPATPLEITASIITTGSQDIISTDSVVQSSLKLDDGDDGSPLPPALPPRPPPRPRQSQGGVAAAALAQLASADQLEELGPGLQQQIRARGKIHHFCAQPEFCFVQEHEDGAGNCRFAHRRNLNSEGACDISEYERQMREIGS